jgi:CRP-like cAMP-binding protein
LTDARVAMIPISRINDIRIVHPNIDTALSLVAMAERSILRHWLLNVGQRNAIERVTHLLCELAVRLQSVGHHNSDGSLDVPVSQTALADTTGMTTVHVNRTLQRLRQDGLVELHRNRLTITDPQRLANTAGFDGDYLRCGRYPD